MGVGRRMAKPTVASQFKENIINKINKNLFTGAFDGQRPRHVPEGERQADPHGDLHPGQHRRLSRVTVLANVRLLRQPFHLKLVKE